MIAPGVATITCGLATGALVLAEWRSWPRARIAAKLAASSCGDDITDKMWGLPAYFAGQLLIAWSLARPSLS